MNSILIHDTKDYGLAVSVTPFGPLSSNLRALTSNL